MDYQQTFLNLPKLTIRENAGHLVTTPEQCAQRFEHTAELAQEVFSVLTLDTKNREIDRHTITIGTLNSSLVHPREVFRVAITDNAAAIILSHNHPSGDATPSSEDIKVTKQLVGAGEVMGIKVLDHVIIGRKAIDSMRDSFLSLRESGLVQFN